MIKLNDENLNRFIDNELNEKESAEIKVLLEDSKSYSKKFEALKLIHSGLINIKEEEPDKNFTLSVMNKIGYGLRSKRTDKYFIFSISSVLFAILLLVSGLIIGSSVSQLQNDSSSGKFIDNLNYYISFIIDIIGKLFSANNISVFGSIISLIILISAYFLFDSLKNSKGNFNH